MSDLVPTFHDLSFYPTVETQTTRYNNLVKSFADHFSGEKPAFLARAPGRVNLIGDHIDYVYFSSLPMAIENDLVAAVSTTNNFAVNVINTDTKYEATTFDLPQDSLLTINKEAFHWTNYVKCGFLVAAKFLHDKHGYKYSDFKGLNIVYDGTVPTGGGLSSSAAISVCSALLFLRANGYTSITKLDLTAITVVSEHYLGMNTGGMDQCASVYGEKSKAMLVHYQPQIYGEIFAFPVIKPYDMVLLISNSLVEANKVETAPTNYNLRVVEFAVAAELLAKRADLKLVADSSLGTGTFRGFLDNYCEQKLGWPHWDGHNIDQALKMFEAILQVVEELYTPEERDGFTTEEAATDLGLTTEQFTQRYLSKYPVRYEKMKLYIRSKHVFTESMNVFRVLKLLSSEPKPTFLQELGQIINDSQYTCAHGVQNSTADIDQICDIALKNGSYGSRVTGAGFGGSVVHITTTDKIDQLTKALTEQYYQKNFPGITQETLDSALIITKPSAGASLVEL
ncbi:galactokinase [Yamadazyma tenuis]|uniref:Galactokinase n=1 Tax=Candida tenuis (strain ATCC 10573 / BCRC 21748 / CBS 615 / JCM 9827 / NBRC 10315 / NRRL Y-1498 / VKM Y-70) TaxID=590646 RepID=G3B7B4_CANTC|nr:Galactokinase [Yamadazyma tenuis ATCC 10573]EGV61614.1 Galactokinase [Yamadazyma tenuis ATCC 10573]WEJ92836.1 galactokinase [Yamadazyma tenuis]